MKFSLTPILASNAYITSQLGHVITLADVSGKINVPYYYSIKSKRVARSVLAAALFATENAVDYVSTPLVTLNKLFGFSDPLYLHTDSNPQFDSVVGLDFISRKR